VAGLLNPSVSKALQTYFRERRERGGHIGDPSDRYGEVSGNAIEQSNTGVFRFTVLKAKRISAPRAETRRITSCLDALTRGVVTVDPPTGIDRRHIDGKPRHARQ
jgi:hypothetical protein